MGQMRSHRSHPWSISQPISWHTMLYRMALGRQPRQRLIVLALGVVLLMLLIRYWRQSQVDWDLLPGEGDAPHVPLPGVKHDKWIVVTSINNPTSAIHRLSNIPDWKLLVVGDRRTPQDWKYPGVVFLDVRHQKSLGYRVANLLPYDSYSRKILGYLYAIEHGAHWIYDTDDDNSPDHLEFFDMANYQRQMLIVQTKNITFNPYVHFGQSTVWPRGYPLEYVGNVAPHMYNLCSAPLPAIQQGLTNGDPDVDAIFRMTRKHNGKKLDITFDSGAPSIMLPHGTFAPLNSQNTLFVAKAFWSLVFPTSVSDRESDIYRGYFAQRLLWLLGDNIAYYPPTNYHHRSKHSYQKDLKEERALYEHMEEYIEYLQKWKCTKVFFFDCVSQLAHDLVQASFWGGRDASLVDAWVADLSNIGYAPPGMLSTPACRSKQPVPVVFYPFEQNTSFSHTATMAVPTEASNVDAVQDYVDSVCEYSSKWAEATLQVKGMNDVLVIIQLHDDLSNIPALEAMYKPWFHHILYCGKVEISHDSNAFLKKWRAAYVKPVQQPSMVSCLDVALRMGYRVNGYLFISDITFLDGTQLHNKHENLMWMTGEIHVYKPDMLASCEKTLNCQSVSRKLLHNYMHLTNEMDSFQERTKQDLQKCFKKLAADPSGQEEITHLTDLVMYIPTRLRDTFLTLSAPFLAQDDRVPYSFLSLLLLECQEVAPDYLTFTSVQDARKQTQKHDYVYPVDSSMVSKRGSDENKLFCSRMPLMKNAKHEL